METMTKKQYKVLKYISLQKEYVRYIDVLNKHKLFDRMSIKEIEDLFEKKFIEKRAMALPLEENTIRITLAGKMQLEDYHKKVKEYRWTNIRSWIAIIISGAAFLITFFNFIKGCSND